MSCLFFQRKDTKTIYLRNSTQIPVHWKLSGLDTLGDDFTVAADSGIVEPKSEYALNAYFRAMKPIQTSKKTIRLEVGFVVSLCGKFPCQNKGYIQKMYIKVLEIQ